MFLTLHGTIPVPASHIAQSHCNINQLLWTAPDEKARCYTNYYTNYTNYLISNKTD